MYSPVLNNYTAGDGRAFWIVGLEGDRHWPALARAVGHAEWLDDERFVSTSSRAVNARELIALLDEIFATKSLDEWAEAFSAEPDLFWSPVNSIDEVLVDDQFHASQAVVRVPDEQGTLPMLATPADFGGSPPSPRYRAPHIGEHTREILAELDLAAEAIEDLLADGIAVSSEPE